jgi:hypothetical protein
MDPPASPSLDPVNPLAGKTRFVLQRRRMGAWERYDVADEPGGGLLLTATRYGHFWRNLLAGVVGVACGLLFAFVTGIRALAAEGDAAQVALGLLALLGGVVIIFLVDILLSPPRDIRGHIPGGDRRAWFRLLEDRKINLRAVSFTLRDRGRLPRARVGKDYLANIRRKRWTARTPEGEELFSFSEESAWRSALHRALGGAFGLFATDYLFLSRGREVGRLHRRPPWRTRFLLTLAPPAEGGPDPALAVAVAVLADSIEWR